MIVLAIDTADLVASVALHRDGQSGPAHHSDEPRAHASHVLALVERVLDDAGVTLAEVDRYAFGRGPGGLTGLRVAASVVQGFACVFERPVVAVSNLRAAALAAMEHGRQTVPDADGVFACHETGMGQIAWCFFAARDGLPVPLGEEALSVPQAVSWRRGKWLAVGSGCARFDGTTPAEGVMLVAVGPAPALAPRLATLGALPDAELMSAAEAQPRYLRHPVNG